MKEQRQDGGAAAPATKPLNKDDILNILKSSSGYHAELKAFDTIRRMKIDCDVSIYYVDKELNEKKAREIDLVIKIPITKNIETEIHEFVMYIVADVKSVYDPIVMLSSFPTMPDRQAVFRGEFIYDTLMPGLSRQKVIMPIHLLNPSGRISRQVLKISTNTTKEKQNRINDAWFRDSAFSTIKATRYFSTIYSDGLDIDIVFGAKSSCFVLIPLVIIDGNIYEHHYNDKGECLESAKYCLARFSVPKDLATEKSEPVDPVVHEGLIVCGLSHLEEFLINIKSFAERHGPQLIDLHVKSANQRIKKSDVDKT